MGSKPSPWLLALVVVALGTASRAAVLRVPEDHGSLSEAIASARPGDEIVLGPGRYSPSTTGETLPWRLAGKGLRIRGAGASATLLDAEQAAGHFEVVDGDTSLLADLTLSGGRNVDGGGAVLVDGGAPTLLRLVLTGCEGGRNGDAILVRRGAARVVRCLFLENGSAGPTVCVESDSTRLERCTWSANAGPAVELRGAFARVTGCVIAGPGLPAGRGVGLLIVAGEADEGPELVDNLFSGCAEGCVRVEGEAGGRLAAALDEARRTRGLRSGDARFVDAAHGDYRLEFRGSLRDHALGAFGGDDGLSPPSASSAGGEDAPAGAMLLGATVPNPFAPQTTIHFTLPAPSVVDLGIYNVLGQRVRTLVAGDLSAGEHTRDWNGRDDHDEELPPGIYFVRITIGDVTESRRLVLVR
ncbi:MAG: FlgD immunoglobulin-like domain containing protein [bacterium]